MLLLLWHPRGDFDAGPAVSIAILGDVRIARSRLSGVAMATARGVSGVTMASSRLSGVELIG